MKNKMRQHAKTTSEHKQAVTLSDRLRVSIPSPVPRLQAHCCSDDGELSRLGGDEELGGDGDAKGWKGW